MPKTVTSRFDIAPFQLPGGPRNEVRFEEPRDIARLVVTFRSAAPKAIGLSYLQQHWPEIRLEQWNDVGRPVGLGWVRMDDDFNCQWRTAKTEVRRIGKRKASLTFGGLAAEFPQLEGIDQYDVRFRRTLGIRLHVPDSAHIENIQVFTTSPPCSTRLHVELDAGKKTHASSIRVDGYNAAVRRIQAESGGSRVKVRGAEIMTGRGGRRAFLVTLDHMQPEWKYCHDDAHVRFDLGRDAFTISLVSLQTQGPVWYAQEGVFIRLADAPASFDSYRRRCHAQQTVAQRVLQEPEQTYDRALRGQPRPHPAAFGLGCRHARQKFWLDPNGDVVLHEHSLRGSGKDTPRYQPRNNLRFFFGREDWPVLGRYPDPPPVPVWHIQWRRESLRVEQTSCAAPLETPMTDRLPKPDDTIIALVRWRFTNEGERPALAELPVELGYAGRARHGDVGGLKSRCEMEPLSVSGRQILGRLGRARVLRAAFETTMRAAAADGRVTFRQRLGPGQSCQVLLKIPYIALDHPQELERLDALRFEHCLRQVRRYWRSAGQAGASLHVPDQACTDLHAAHPAHVLITDYGIPGRGDLVNTSVGFSTYGNFSNESCMIVQELEERGLIEEARRRLAVWVEYQGTVPLPGNYTDHRGVYYGAGGLESGGYNQHHGWVLWRLCEHLLLTGDRRWFAGVVDSVVAGADWVFRQRRNTMTSLPLSRGWEHGFLPAGSLEDVKDFRYWLSTNVLTWRGCQSCACALEAAGHPQAARIRREADAFAADLRNGLETARMHSPLVRLGNGHWVPHYPSRLYCRGRDLGWIREVLEGSIYLLLSGLYDMRSRQAQWILDDYQDNLYMTPPYGYRVDPEPGWFSRGGFSMQPNLLAGLLPYLYRDEPELYVWMFFNAWCSCYRPEINTMIEHPTPVLGYDNAAPFKTSDQANAIMWLRYMLVCRVGDTLHYGRAMPGDWLRRGQRIELRDVLTRFGKTSVAWEPDLSRRRITATIKLPQRTAPGTILVRFRHGEARPLRSVTVNGRRWLAFDPTKADVDLTGLSGTVRVAVRY